MQIQIISWPGVEGLSIQVRVATDYLRTPELDHVIIRKPQLHGLKQCRSNQHAIRRLRNRLCPCSLQAPNRIKEVQVRVTFLCFMCASEQTPLLGWSKLTSNASRKQRRRVLFSILNAIVGVESFVAYFCDGDCMMQSERCEKKKSERGFVCFLKTISFWKKGLKNKKTWWIILLIQVFLNPCYSTRP